MIKIRGLSKRFRRHQVLSGINLSLNKGDRVALVGSNGAGKTTLIRCLLGEYHYQGVLEIDGLDSVAHRRQNLQRIGFVPQLPPPLKMQVYQLLRFASGVCGTDPLRMRDIAAQLGLDIQRIGSQVFNKLSGGQKQKLLISIALGRQCDILVLDEPAANLDPEARATFLRLLAQDHQDTTMLISSHRLDEVAALVNRVVELDQGTVILDDHVEDQLDLSAVLDCELTIKRPDMAFARAVGEWGFVTDSTELFWKGEIQGADRLRFLGMLSRYAALLNAVHIEDRSVQNREEVHARLA